HVAVGVVQLLRKAVGEDLVESVEEILVNAREFEWHVHPFLETVGPIWGTDFDTSKHVEIPNQRKSPPRKGLILSGLVFRWRRSCQASSSPASDVLWLAREVDCLRLLGQVDKPRTCGRSRRSAPRNEPRAAQPVQRFAD